MKKFSAAVVSLALIAAPAFAQTTAAKPPESAPAAATQATPYYTIDDSTIGDLLSNPATKAVLVKYLPEVALSERVSMAKTMTLSEVQQYSSDKITDEKLSVVAKELANIPGPK